MLTTSPVIASSANASPGTFHYAHSRSSPHHSPSRHPIPSPRARQQQQQPRPSLVASMTSSPVQPRPRPYVAVDASTQYSPMEQPISHPVPAPAGQPVPHANPPPPPQPRPMDASTPVPTSAPDANAAIKTLSPGKRRSSADHGRVVPSASVTGSASQQRPASPCIAKRPKPEAGPPKVLPRRYELCMVEDLVVLISHMLAELIETNDALALRSGNLTRFHSRTAPGISVPDYLNRLAKHATLTPPLLLSMVYYIDRLCALYPEFTINTLTVHRFLITAATVAAKGLSDSFWNNTTYARVGGVRVQELKLLELEFLYRVEWKIVPNPEVLEAYYRGLIERCPGYALEDAESSSGDDEEASDDLNDETGGSEGSEEDGFLNGERRHEPGDGRNGANRSPG